MTFKLKTQSVSEHEIELTIGHYLWRKGIYFWKSIQAGYYDAQRKIFRKQVSPFVKNGLSDYNGYFNNVPLAIEVKSEKECKYVLKHYEILKNYVGPDKRKTHLREQIDHIEMTIKNGGIGFFACSVDQVKEKLFPEEVKK